MSRAVSFAFHLTYTCPLSCAHCCFSSGPKVKDTLDPEYVLQCIDNLPNTIDLVAFTGGEPFLHGANLTRYVTRVTARGMRTRVVTSAYFAKTPELADRKLRPLADAGLGEISISWDDHHEVYSPFSCVRNLCGAAVEMGLTTAINIVQTGDSFWTRQRVLDELGPLADKVIVVESAFNRTGRAEVDLAERPLRENTYVGPCPFVLTGPTMSGKGDLIACCGVIPKTDALTLAPTPAASEIEARIEESLDNELLNWLHFRGPYAIMEWIAADQGVTIPAKEELGGNCEACKLLFSQPELAPHVRDAVERRAHLLAGEKLMLGMIHPESWHATTKLWKDPLPA